MALQLRHFAVVLLTSRARSHERSANARDSHGWAAAARGPPGLVWSCVTLQGGSARGFIWNRHQPTLVGWSI